MEISRITKFLLDRIAVFQVKVKSNHYLRNPTVKGGLEIPCEMTIKIPKSAFTVSVLERYDILLNDWATSWKVLSCFMDIHHSVQEYVPGKTKPIDDTKNREITSKIKGHKINVTNGPKNSKKTSSNELTETD